jgi:hypothetical protein
MMTIAIWAVVVLTSVANPTAVYKGTTIASSKAGQSTKVSYNCHELRALTLNGVSQVLRCEPEHGVAEDDHAAISRRFSDVGK